MLWCRAQFSCLIQFILALFLLLFNCKLISSFQETITRECTHNPLIQDVSNLKGSYVQKRTAETYKVVPLLKTDAEDRHCDEC